MSSLAAPLLLAALLAEPGVPSERPVTLIGAMGFDHGFTELIKVRYGDGSSEALGANEGFVFAVGLGFLKLHLDEVALDTAATIGVKGWDIGGDNGKLDYLAFPLELLERAAFRQVRLGAGLSYCLAPRLKASGVLAASAVDLEDALGVTVQGEWIGRRRPGQVGAMVGVRFLAQRLRSKATGRSVEANALGLTLGMEY